MKPSSDRNAGICLLIGSLLMFVTMVLHPTGGDLAHIREIWWIIVISHAIAITSIPFLTVGFWGIAVRLKEADFLSKLGLSVILTGLVSVMIAAAINGLTYPIYAEMFEGSSDEMAASLSLVTRYGSALNQAFDYIFMASVCSSLLLMSFAILKAKSFPSYLGYLGLVLSLTAIVMWVAGFVFVDLHGFRFFIFGWIIWVVLMGYHMLTEPRP